MRRPQTLPVAVAVAALSAGFVLTACSGGSSSDSAAKNPSASTTSGATDTASASPADGGGSTDAPSAPASADPASTGGTSQPSPASDKVTGGPAGSERCHTAGLSFSVAPGSGAQSVGSAGPVIIAVANRTSHACTLKGYPGVDLVGGSQRWSLTRQTSATPHLVTLRPGGRTSFTITYMPFTAGSGQKMDVKTIAVTPPDETTSATVAWEFQPVLLQDGATHPATYVGPVGAE